MPIDPKKYVETDSQDTPIIIYRDKGVVTAPLAVTPSTESQEITPEQGVDGFVPVTVSAVNATIDNNIRPDNIKAGVTILGVSGSIDPFVGQAKTVNPTTSEQVVEPDDGYTGLSSVTVGAVTSAIDSDIQATNIKSGVTILGVAGSVTELQGDTLEITPTTSAQSFSPSAPKNGYTSVSVGAVTSAIDANITANNIKSGVSILGITGNVIESNLTSVEVTPTQSEQTIEPTGDYNGFSSVSVGAVTSSIDSNIQAGNIKSGVTILGVPGTVTELNADTLSVTPSTSAQSFSPSAPKNGYSTVSVSAVTNTIDANIQAGNIKSGVSILGVNGTVTELNPSTLSVTPSTAAQTITPTSPSNGFTEVTVSAVTSAIDPDIQAGNIKSGVNILGVTGSYTGFEPSGTLNISANGTYNVHDYESAVVAIPTKTFGIDNRAWIGEVQSDGTLSFNFASPNPDFTGLKVIPSEWLHNKFMRNSYITGNLNMGDVETIYSNGCYYAFSEAGLNGSVDLSSLTYAAPFACAYMFGSSYYPGAPITSLDMSGLVSATNSYSFQNMCRMCGSLTTVNLSSLQTINGGEVFGYAFQDCTALTSVNLSSLTTIAGGSCNYMFRGCTALTSIDLSSLTTAFYVNSMFYGCTSLATVNLSSLAELSSFYRTFYGCTSLTSITFPALASLGSSDSLQYTFENCTGLTSVSFPALTSNSFGNWTTHFDNMLSGCSGVTVHFPSNLQSVIGSWTAITNGMGGTNTTILFDLTATN